MNVVVLIVTCCVWGSMLLCSTAGLAQQRPQELCDEPLDFGLISDSLGTMNSNINSDLVALLASKSGCRIRIVPMPVKRVNHELKIGNLDMSGRFFQTDERDQFLWFAHVQRTKVLGWFRSDDMTQADALSVMKSGAGILGVTAGFKHSATIDRLVSDRQATYPGRTVEFPDRRALFLGLLARRVDMILLPESVVEELNAMLNAEGVQLASVDLVPSEAGALGGIVFSKRRFNAMQAAYWQSVVKDLCEDGSILRVFQRYFKATEKDVACSPMMD